jgi:hypothetical protein
MKPNHPTFSAPIRLHAELGGKIFENRKEAKRLAGDTLHLEAVIRMFSPDFNFKAIAARRRYKGSGVFKRGTLFRAALDALRAGPGPLTVREIVDAILAAKGVTGTTAKQRTGLEAGLRASLENHAGKTVERVGDGVPRRWRLST